MSEIGAVMTTILKNDYDYECNENGMTALHGGK